MGETPAIVLRRSKRRLPQPVADPKVASPPYKEKRKKWKLSTGNKTKNGNAPTPSNTRSSAAEDEESDDDDIVIRRPARKRRTERVTVDDSAVFMDLNPKII